MVEIRLPDWNQRKLERAAEAHAVDVALAYERMPGDAPVDRLVVNMLRHEFTSYDADQTQAAHQQVREAIAQRFPWLKVECERQISARAQAEAEEAAALTAYEKQLAAEAAERQQRVSNSKVAITQFSEGIRVRAKVKGHVRDATVLKVGRTRLTIGFKIKTGAERTAQLHACDVEAI